MLNGRSLVPLNTHVEPSLAVFESLDRVRSFRWKGVMAHLMACIEFDQIQRIYFANHCNHGIDMNRAIH